MRSSVDLATADSGEVNAGLAVVAELGAALASVRTGTEVHAALRRRLKWLLPATHVALAIVEDDEYRLITPAGESWHRLDDGLIGWSIGEGIALDLVDASDPAQLPPGAPPSTTGGAQIILPLRAESEIVGALVIGSPKIGAYLDTDRGLVNLIALQVTSAVRTVQFLDELDGAESIIASMAKAVEAKDAYTWGHADRVTEYGVALAAAAGLSGYVREIVARSGPLHDVGKIGVPDSVLGKPGHLTDDEFELIKRHPVIGDEICRPLRSLRKLRAGIRSHHERYDGRGYPDRLAGTAIPIEARVLAIADTFDAMTSNRPYRNGMPVERALAIIGANEGPQWDPGLVAVFLAMQPAVLRAA